MIARDSRSRDKVKRQACTHTDGQREHQKDGGVNHERKKKWKGRRRDKRNVSLLFPMDSEVETETKPFMTQATFH